MKFGLVTHVSNKLRSTERTTFKTFDAPDITEAQRRLRRELTTLHGVLANELLHGPSDYKVSLTLVKIEGQAFIKNGKVQDLTVDILAPKHH